MASWKKVIVSGSSAALTQLSVDTHITASGNISSSGDIIASGLTLSGNISVTQITASIISASTSLIASTAAVSDLTDNQVVIAGTGGELEGDANLTFDANTLSGTNLIVSAATISGSAISGSFFGDGTNLNLAGNATIPAGEWDGTRDGNSQITGSGAGPSLVLSGSTGDDLLVKKNAKVEGKILSTDFDTIVAGNVTLFDTVGDFDLTIGAATTTVKLPGDLIELGNGAGDLVDIKGNLSVAGTASFTSAQNLNVADKYILLNSGSSGNSDSGGIVIQGPTQDVGSLFGYISGSSDSDTTRRWGVVESFNADTSADFTPEAFMANVVVSSDDDPDTADDVYKKSGNIYIDTTNGIPYIYA